MTQVELDTMYSIQANLSEIANQLKIKNTIDYIRLRIANGGFANPEEFAEIRKSLGIEK